MVETNIVLKKENLISLTESIFKLSDQDKVCNIANIFFDSIIQWQPNTLALRIKHKDNPEETKKLIIKELNLLSHDITLEDYNFIKFQNLNQNILIDFCDKEENTIPLINTLKLMLNNDNLKVCFIGMYLEMVDLNLVNPLSNEESLIMFNEVAKQSFNSENTMMEKEIKKIKENTLLIIFDKNFTMEQRKEAFCQYIENTEFDFENRQLKYIYDCLKEQDFSNYYKNYTVIRDFYKSNEEESIVENICSTSIQFNIIKNAKNYNLESHIYSDILQKGHWFAVKKSRQILDIENCLDVISESIFKIYINSYENNPETQLFVEKYKKFLELLPEIANSAMKIVEKDLEEQWNSVSLFVEMNNKTPEKKSIAKKKV